MTKNLLLKTVKRLDRSLSGQANNFSEQFMYGHREILIAYSGVEANWAIKGSIAHGWSPLDPNFGVPKLFGKRFIHLAWSSRDLHRFNYKYASNVVPIGAPFLYLCKLFDELKVAKLSTSRDFLFIPAHGSELSSPKVESLIANYQTMYDPNKTTVQLYWTEFLEKRIRDAYLSKGFDVVTAGFSGLSSREGLGISTRERAMSTIGGRHLFLLRVLINLHSHSEVIFSHFGTSTLYAGYLKKRIHLLNSDKNFTYTVLNNDTKIISGHDAENDFVQREIFVKYFNNDGVAQPNFEEFCAMELGFNDLLTSSDLAKLISTNYFLLKSDSPVTELLQQLKLSATDQNVP